MRPRRNRNVILTALLIAWGSTIAWGMTWFQNYESTPGPATLTSGEWPADSGIRFIPGRINIVMLAHPRCPCTRASIDELKALLDRCPDQATAHILFWTPRDAGPDWTQTDLWTRARSMANVQAHVDEMGVEARRFGAATSGHVLIFKGDGTRIYSGGLTTARGQSADGQTAAVICGLIDNSLPAPAELPVFGCPLYDPSAQCIRGTKASRKCQ